MGVSFKGGSSDKPKRTKSAAPTLSTTPCPECGVSVAKGYVECPKCHAKMPSVQSPLTKQLGKAGGTTIMTPARTGAWIFVLLCAIATATIWFMARRAGERPGSSSSATPGVERGDDAFIGDGGAATEPEPPKPVATPEQRTAALDKMEAKLADISLWSWVDIDERQLSVLELRSTHCADEQLMITINEARAELGAIGIDAARCIARNNVIEWEEPLK